VSAPLVSVVTPFHNTAQWLDACIASVHAQTFTDFEYLLVNNHSSDGSGEIARRHAQQDPRLRVVDQPAFLGQVENFNAALRLISPASRYCKLVLADDLLMPECLASMVRVAERWPRAGLVTSYYLKGPTLMGGGLPYPEECFAGRDVARSQLLEGNFFIGSPTTVLYRAEIVRSRPDFYEVGRLHEDTEAGYRIMKEWDVGFVHQVLSFLRVEPDSLSGRASGWQPHLLDAYIVLRTFGRDFLSPAEYRLVERRLTRRYFGFLGLASWYKRDPGFWAYHERGLATVAERFAGWRRRRWRLAALGYVIAHPAETWRAVARRLGPGSAAS
jgi:glycosyltransferase involved in cell wall biosynthesis